MNTKTVKTDIAVIGGGLAGMCAAIAAARLGRTVALVQNRPVLGGNSSSEIRVWVCGATKHGINRYARETGIMGELFLENQYRNPDGNPYLWDLLLLEKVKAEKNILLFLNTEVQDVAVFQETGRKIAAVTGWVSGSETRICFESEMFLDCTGDGMIGALAGADYRIGRESRFEFNESLGPEKADKNLLGSTILFYTKDAGHPVKFVSPPFATEIAKTSIPKNRVIRSTDSGCCYWWIELGGEIDIVAQNESIRDELWSIVYGIWDYIKNSGKFEAGNLTLEWVGAIPGKREYRRFVGDYVLNQNDVLNQTEFEDRIAFGGWSIDLHPPQGIYTAKRASENIQSDGVFHIPYRSLYSVNVDNLLFAGRSISVTHIAFGATRVQATCAIVGEAAGTAAALCLEEGISPREIYHHRLKKLQQVLLKQDASLLGIANQDAQDKARSAKVSASSTMEAIEIIEPDETFNLTTDAAVLFPWHGRLDGIELLISTEITTELEVELWNTGKAQNYVPQEKLQACQIQLNPGKQQWVSASLAVDVPKECNFFFIIKANQAVDLHVSTQPVTGVLAFTKKLPQDTNMDDYIKVNAIVEWTMNDMRRKVFCFKIAGNTDVFCPEKVINGYVRPYGGPHMWVSKTKQKQIDEWLELSWDNEIVVKEVHLTFNDDVNEDLINLHHHYTGFPVIPELIKNYRVESWNGGEWVAIFRQKDNRKRKIVFGCQEHLKTCKLRVVAEETNGSPRAEVVEVRVYS